MPDIKRPVFNLSLIGEADKRNLCSTFLESIKTFYDNPENCKRFEKWKDAKNNKEQENRTPA